MLLAALVLAHPARAVTVVLQPLGPFDSSLVDAAVAGIVQLCERCSVVVAPTVPLPQSAYYPPRKRYRAEKLLAWLDSTAADGADRVVGLTRRDISTTKDTFPDWGIFGLGWMPGRACVVSTFRLGRTKVSREQFVRRFVDVVKHELGHTFGLAHCATVGCLMEDAKGTIATVDRSTGKLCAQCRALFDIALDAYEGVQ